MTKTIVRFAGVIVLITLGFIPALSMAVQTESPVTCVEQPQPLSLTYGDHTVGCRIETGTPTDLDQFQFVGVAGDQIRINVESLSGNVDPSLELWDPHFLLIDQASCTNTGCTYSLDITLSKSGTYTLFMSDLGTNETGNYLLQLERIQPVPASVHLNYDSSVSDGIAPQTDIDFYTFNVTAGTEIRLNVESLSGNVDPTVEIRDPNGMVILNGSADGASCNQTGCTFSVDLPPLVLSGTYSLLLYDFNTNDIGDYVLSLWCVFGPCDGIPDPSGPMVSYVTPESGTIDPQVDGAFYIFNVTAGTEIRLNVESLSGNVDPTVEIRDPNGTVILNGSADGASCNQTGCTFSVDLPPLVLSGTYSLLLYDFNTNDIGDYVLSLWCVFGSCDSDADGVTDGDPPVLFYDGIEPTHPISPQVDGDFFIFGGTEGERLRLSVQSMSGNVDPTVEIRDPIGTVILNGLADGASCNQTGCTFSVDLPPLTLSGNYSLLIYDLSTNEIGDYNIGLQCLFGPLGSCGNTAVSVCGDNCIDVSNGPLTPGIDPSNIQRDTDGDDYGNMCDGDLNNDGDTNTLDLNLYKLAHRTECGDPNYDPDADFNGDCRINTLDLNIYKGLHRKPPRPSCPVAP